MTKETNDSVPDSQFYSDTLQLQKGNSRILYQKTCKLDVFSEIFSEQYWQEKKAITGSASGRGQTLFIRYKSSDLIFRPYLRGGLPGKILKDQFLFTGYENARAWREFLLLLDMLALGLPVPEPVAAGIHRSGLICRNHIIIKRIPGAKDLHQILCHETLASDIWKAVGSCIRQFHQQQIYHHDLNIRNIMLDAKKQTWLIDFDRCGIIKGDSWKQQNLNRLHRSFLKEQAKHPALHWNNDDWQALLAGYEQKC